MTHRLTFTWLLQVLTTIIPLPLHPLSQPPPILREGYEAAPLPPEPQHEPYPLALPTSAGLVAELEKNLQDVMPGPHVAQNYLENVVAGAFAPSLDEQLEREAAVKEYEIQSMAQLRTKHKPDKIDALKLEHPHIFSNNELRTK